MPEGMMRLITWVQTPTGFWFVIQILDIGIWDIVPEHWTFVEPDMTTPEVMTLDNQWNNNPSNYNETGWPMVVDSSNVGGYFYVKWDTIADGYSPSNPNIYWTFCSGVVRLGDASGGF